MRGHQRRNWKHNVVIVIETEKRRKSKAVTRRKKGD